jgi:periplasmic glucans biosynthesis protein
LKTSGKVLRQACRCMCAAALIVITTGVSHGAEPKVIEKNTSRAFGFEKVEEIASQAAAKAYSAPAKIPEFLQRLNYDQWRDIRFKRDRALWRGEDLLFEAQFIHPGFLYHVPVKINVVDGSEISELNYSPDHFNFGMNDFGHKLPADLGFAGFRFHYPVNRPDVFDEVIVFLGASYFRAVAKGQWYGLSARGLAIDVAEQKGEEFPYFKEFWLVKPRSGQAAVTIYALLDSPSVSGAYHFIVEPGEHTLVHVRSTLFLRREIRKIGLAPLTSMFLHGENHNVRGDDFRPEVHDSDGLLVGRGEWIWRPLRNPRVLSTSKYLTERLQGFGLMQRDTEFASYQDLEAFYHNRPSAWVTPLGDWGSGHVELVEIPTTNEYNDNIIAYWVPTQKLPIGRPITLAYRMNWYSPQPDRLGLGWVTATRTSATNDPAKRRFLIDFKGGRLERLDDAMALDPVVTVTRQARVHDLQLKKNNFGDSWRLVFTVTPAEKELLDKVMAGTDKAIDIRAFLRQEGNAVTETWSYSFEP